MERPKQKIKHVTKSMVHAKLNIWVEAKVNSMTSHASCVPRFLLRLICIDVASRSYLCKSSMY